MGEELGRALRQIDTAIAHLGSDAEEATAPQTPRSERSERSSNVYYARRLRGDEAELTTNVVTCTGSPHRA